MNKLTKIVIGVVVAGAAAGAVAIKKQIDKRKYSNLRAVDAEEVKDSALETLEKVSDFVNEHQEQLKAAATLATTATAVLGAVKAIRDIGMKNEINKRLTDIQNTLNDYIVEDRSYRDAFIDCYNYNIGVNNRNAEKICDIFEKISEEVK